MQKALMTIAALAALILSAAPSHDQSLALAQPQGREDITGQEYEMMEWANHERELRGLKPLEVDFLLVEIGREHSEEMARLGYFDHFSPTPGMKTPLDRYLAHISDRPQWVYVGENLYYCSVVDPARGHRKLMESPTHKENILDPKFQRIGVGIFIDDSGRFWVTQMFCAESED
jgi:uncharacterized protein YkwD